MISETDRLWIRQFSPDDIPALTTILGDPEVMRYSVRGVHDEDATRKFVEWCIDCYATRGFGPWALVEKSSSELIGLCGLALEPVADALEINLGYRLARSRWGVGLATESVRAMLAYAFDVKVFPSVVVLIEPAHAASLRVAEKVGFQQFENTTFHHREVRLYRMAREQWKGANRRQA